jgi:hypothetical protein
MRKQAEIHMVKALEDGTMDVAETACGEERMAKGHDGAVYFYGKETSEDVRKVTCEACIAVRTGKAAGN